MSDYKTEAAARIKAASGDGWLACTRLCEEAAARDVGEEALRTRCAAAEMWCEALGRQATAAEARADGLREALAMADRHVVRKDEERKAAEAERDQLKARMEELVENSRAMDALSEQLLARVTAAEARAEALLGYACHAETCEFNEYGEAWDCTCGLDNLRGGK